MPNSKSVKPPGTSFSASQAFDFGDFIAGEWTYRDSRQLALVMSVQEFLGWDIRRFDAWLFGQDHWKNYPRVRQRMMEMRGRLSAAVLGSGASQIKSQRDIKYFFREIRALSIRLDNLPDTLRQDMLAVVGYKAAPASSKLDAKSIARIQRMYKEMVLSGQKYGAQTVLAKQYGLSLATIRKLLQDNTTV